MNPQNLDANVHSHFEGYCLKGLNLREAVRLKGRGSVEG